METNVLGFNVLRSTSADGSDRQVLNSSLILSQFDPQGGASYKYIDSTAQEGTVY
ncbi:MAG: hypothetical protein HGB05_08840, partial [Chloroflexi bacterium]|nr:hypothetical protein [Chloroflexota bacterium]